MRLFCWLALMGVLGIGCHSRPILLTEAEVCHVYLDSLSRRFPDVKFTAIDERTLSSSYQGKEMRHYVDNMYADYTAQPESLRSILQRYMSSAGELYSRDLDKAVMKENIVAIIKPVEYLEETQKMANEMGAKKDIGNLYDKYNDQLIILYAVDSKNNIQYLLSGQLEGLGIKRDSLRSLAIRNLQRLLTDVKIEGGDGVFMFTAGGNYEASLILMQELWTKENLPVKGDFVIAVAARDLLLISGSQDKTGIEKNKRNCQKSIFDGELYHIGSAV